MYLLMGVTTSFILFIVSSQQYQLGLICAATQALFYVLAHTHTVQKASQETTDFLISHLQNKATKR